MKKIGSVKLVIFFTALTVVLTCIVIFAYESFLRGPFYSWVEARYPADKQVQDRIKQQVEHFWISTMVDLIVVTMLLGLINRRQSKVIEGEKRYRALFEHAGNGIGVVSATRRDSGGTDLGLSVRFGIIHDYGGQTWVESEEGSYTRFILGLPAEISGEAEYAQSLAGRRRAEHSLDDGRTAQVRRH